MIGRINTKTDKSKEEIACSWLLKQKGRKLTNTNVECFSDGYSIARNLTEHFSESFPRIIKELRSVRKNREDSCGYSGDYWDKNDGDVSVKAERIATMTTLEQIRVMKAFVDGKQIECMSCIPDNSGWHETSEPVWDWGSFCYRIKPENKLVPYDCQEEFIEGMKEHGPYLKDNDGILKMPLVIGKAAVVVGFREDQPTYEELARNYWWQDGSPCGIMQ